MTDLYDKIYYQVNKDRFKTKRQENIEKMRSGELSCEGLIERRLYLAAKHRAKRKGVPFNIELSDIVIPDICPVLGLQIDRLAFDRQVSPSLDRVIPELGYTKGNIQVISMRANRLKSDTNLEDAIKLVSYLKSYSN